MKVRCNQTQNDPQILYDPITYHTSKSVSALRNAHSVIIIIQGKICVVTRRRTEQAENTAVTLKGIHIIK